MLAQIVRFVFVGGISFLVDFLVYGLLCNGLHIHYIFAGIAGFLVSVVVNYLLSMRYVFTPKENLRKDKEFLIFVILSTLGLMLNEVILYLSIDFVYPAWMWLNQSIDAEKMNLLAKIVSTAVVMVYNFVTRKIFLEKR